MKAVLATGGPGAAVGEITLNEILDEKEVRVEIEMSALCRSEVFSVSDEFVFSPRPSLVGHSAVARVTEIGSAVTRVAVGNRVAVCSTLQCDECWFCSHGSPDACIDLYGKALRVVGVDDQGRNVTADLGLGSHAQEMIYPQSALVPLDTDLPSEALALLGCGILSGVGAVTEIGRVSPGQSVAISGVGPLGMWMVQGARLSRAETIIVIDPIAERREIALRLGATHALDLTEDVVERVRELTEGRGVDVGLEAAGSTHAMEQSYAMTRQGGVVVPTGIESPTATVTLPGLEYAISGREIRSSQGGGGNILADVPKFTKYLEDGLLDWNSIITARRSIDEASAAYDDSRDRTGLTTVLDPHH